MSDKLIDFPWREYNDKDLLKCFQNLKKKINKQSIVFPLKFSYVGYKCTDAFFQKERLSVASDTNVSCVDYWNKHKKNIIKYYENPSNTKDLFATIVYMRRAPSHFSPCISALIYKYFNATCVLDPYAGWGDRCLAALALDIDYIGIDSNPNLETCFNNMISFYKHTSNIKFIKSKSENVDYTDIIPDLIFSSPPFWNSSKRIIEKYPYCEEELEIFLSKSLFPLFDRYIRIVPISLYINDVMYDAICEKYGKANKILTFATPHIKKGESHKIIRNIYCWMY